MRLSEDDKKKIVIDYGINPNKREIARKYGVSDTTVKRIVEDPEMLDLLQNVAQKKEEAALDLDTYMQQRTGKFISALDMLLDALVDPKKIEAASVNQITTSIGTIIDKLTMTGTGNSTAALNIRIAPVQAPEQPPDDIEEESDE